MIIEGCWVHAIEVSDDVPHGESGDAELLIRLRLVVQNNLDHESVIGDGEAGRPSLRPQKGRYSQSSR